MSKVKASTSDFHHIIISVVLCCSADLEKPLFIPLPPIMLLVQLRPMNLALLEEESLR